MADETETSASPSIRPSDRGERSPVAAIAHDLTNVLTAAQTLLDLLLADESIPSHALARLKTIAQITEHSGELARQLISKEGSPSRDSRVDMNTVVSRATTTLRSTLPPSVELHLDLHPRLPEVMGHAANLERIVTNLAANARDALDGAGTITVATRVVDGPVAAARGAGALAARPFVVVTVCDTGPGVAESMRTRIFEPHVTTKRDGTGLGLATVRDIVREHGGAIELERGAPGKGATFHVFLPAHERRGPERRASVPPPELAGRNERILFVEDDASVRSAVTTALRRYGYQVTDVGSYRDGLAAWQERAADFEIVLTDLVLHGDATGTLLAERVLAESQSSCVVLTSGNETPTDAIARPRFAFLAKPYAPHRLAQVLRALLDQR